MTSAPFRFVGKIPPSKSLLNRALIVESFSEAPFVKEHSAAKDVVHLKAALNHLRSLRGHGSPRSSFFCGDGGTTLRFLALRLARESGHFQLKMSERLRERPHNSLIKCLRQLGAETTWSDEGLELQSDGFHLLGDSVHLDFDGTTQVASSLVLNSWDLPFDLFFRFTPQNLSVGYWTMTLRLVEEYGMKVDSLGPGEYRIPARQKVQNHLFRGEPDMSSAFAIAAHAALNGSAQFLDWPPTSLQPDFYFSEILERMGVEVKHFDQRLSVISKEIKPIVISMSRVPDLFPVLAALCAFADGESFLFGAPQLKFKESDRLLRTQELLCSVGVACEILDDGLKIQGQKNRKFSQSIQFDPDHDHRMAMACSLFMRAGAPIHVESPEVVEKSFPEFWRIVGIS